MCIRDRDIGVIDIELIMADVEMVERRIDKAQKAAKGDKKYLREVEDVYKRQAPRPAPARPAPSPPPFSSSSAAARPRAAPSGP